MKPLLAILLGVLVCVGVTACGGSSANTTAMGSHLPRDRDGDHDNNNDDQHVFDFGHPADAVETKEVASILARFFADAAAENGAGACSLLTPLVAETVVERDGHSPGLRGNTCAEVMSKLFAEHHRELVEKSPRLKIIRVGVVGTRSLVALEFPKLSPELRQITMRRVGDRWTVLYLLDNLIE